MYKKNIYKSKVEIWIKVWTLRVSAIPAKSATSLAPYGRTLYEIVNLCLGNDINLISNVVDEVESINFRYKSIRDKRNQYDILNGRGKYYGSWKKISMENNWRRIATK